MSCQYEMDFTRRGALSEARLSPCGRYRYTLSRVWRGAGRSSLVICMLNPSTADATEDDATIRKCMGFWDESATAEHQPQSAAAARPPRSSP